MVDTPQVSGQVSAERVVKAVVQETESLDSKPETLKEVLAEGVVGISKYELSRKGKKIKKNKSLIQRKPERVREHPRRVALRDPTQQGRMAFNAQVTAPPHSLSLGLVCSIQIIVSFSVRPIIGKDQ